MQTEKCLFFPELNKQVVLRGLFEDRKRWQGLPNININELWNRVVLYVKQIKIFRFWIKCIPQKYIVHL